MHLIDKKSFLSDADSIQQELWESYFLNPTIHSRNLLVNYYREFSRKIATRVFASRKSSFKNDINDCYQTALVALMESISTYNPSYEVQFTTYASYRIKGAIHSLLDKESEKSSISAYNFRKKFDRWESLQSCTESTGEFEELLELTLDIAATELLDIDVFDIDFSKEEAHQQQPYDHPIEYSISCELWKIVHRFNDPDKRIIIEHYLNQLQFNDIAELLSISKGRVSQLHSRAVKNLREIYISKKKFNEKI